MHEFAKSLGFLGLLFVCAGLHAEDATELRETGIRLLKSSQSNSPDIVPAARSFAKAQALFAKAGDEEKAVEMNSFLYWCKKKMTLADIEQFTKSPDAPQEMPAPATREAQKWFDRAEKFAQANPQEHLLIAIRFFEVADRFIGTRESLTAQDRSLKEQTLAQEKAGGTPVALPSRTTPTPTGARPTPPAEKLKDAEKILKDLFKAEYSKTDAASRMALHARMLSGAEEVKDDPASEYVFIREALTLAVAAGDSTRAIDAYKRLRASFVLDDKTTDLHFRTMESTARTLETAKAMTALCLFVSDEELTRENFEHAVRMAALAEDVSSYAKDPALKAHCKAENLRMQGLLRESALAAAASKTLATKPDDPAANLALGRFALARGDFDKAVPMLAKCGDASLSGLAKRDLSAPQDPQQMAQLADAWYERVEKEQTNLKSRLRERAAFWYAKALPGISGIAKIKVEQRLKELDAAAKPAVAVSEPKKAEPAKAPAGAGWVDLFNGKDLAGWSKTGSANWEVKNGVLVGSDGSGNLQSDRSDYFNMVIRVEAMINDSGNSGVFFRNYEAQIEANGPDTNKTGGLYKPGAGTVAQVKQTPAPANTWFTMTITADGARLTTEVDGKKIIEYSDSNIKSGRIALQCHHKGSVISFRRIQVKELPK